MILRHWSLDAGFRHRDPFPESSWRLIDKEGSWLAWVINDLTAWSKKDAQDRRSGPRAISSYSCLGQTFAQEQKTQRETPARSVSLVSHPRFQPQLLGKARDLTTISSPFLYCFFARLLQERGRFCGTQHFPKPLFFNLTGPLNSRRIKSTLWKTLC